MAPERRPVPIHRLRPNETEWSPPVVICADTETVTDHQGDTEVEVLALWCAHITDRDGKRHRQPADPWGAGRTAGGFAAWVDQATSGRNTVWLYTHNLNFDLVTTRLPLELAALGWTVSDFSLRGGAPWLRLRKGGHNLTVCDSYAWLPYALGDIGDMVNLAKPPLPEDRSDTAALVERCRGDVEILEGAILDLMGWWDRERLGRWTITGAGCGWNAYRHRPTDDRCVIDPDPALMATDRLALRGGRRDAARYGDVKGGPFAELDFTAAYPTIAATFPLPTHRRDLLRGEPRGRDWLHDERVALAATVTVQTDTPRWPVTHDGVTWHPVGVFTTTLAGPELTDAADRGAIVAWHGGQLHQLGWHLRPWAEWCLALQSGEIPDTPRVAQKVAKSWGRSVIGKFAARSHTAEQLGDSPIDGWAYTDAWSATTGRPGAVVDLAGRRWAVTYDTEPENAYPAVLAWVESHVRLRLSNVLDRLGEAWVSANTDGVVVDLSRVSPQGAPGGIERRFKHRDPLKAAERLCDRLAPLCEPLVIRVKDMSTTLEAWGPAQLVTDGVAHVAGVHRDAERVGERTFTARDWPKVRWQLEHGDPSGYVRPLRTVTMEGPMVHRWVESTGRTLPAEFSLGAQGENRILSWGESPYAERGYVRTRTQYRTLSKLG